MTRRILVAAVSMLLLLSMRSQAHHSGVIFDHQVSIELQGTVSEFQWTNPHCWIQLNVAEGTHAGEWSIELGNIAQLYRLGWRPATLQPGQAITVTVHPMRDGSQAALYREGIDINARPRGPGAQTR